MIGSAYITYNSNNVPLLNFECTGENTEVITKASVYSQSTWGSDNPHWTKTYANVTSIEELGIASEALEGACLNKDLIIVKVEYNIGGVKSQPYIMITYNKKIEINKTLSYCKELCDCCKFPDGLLNSLLQVKALQYAIEANDVDRAITYWNKWYKGEWGCENSSNNNGGCNCG